MVIARINNYKFEVDGYMKSNLDIMLNDAIPNNWDSVGIYLGGEGTGKTTLVSQHALFLDNRYTLKNCQFLANQFEDFSNRCPDESSVHWDEAVTGAMAAAHASKMQQAVISQLTQIRKKRLKIFMCFPYLSLLRRYFLERCLYGIYVYAKDFNDRGYAKFYSQPKLMELHYLVKEKYKYNPNAAFKKVKPNFFFHFSKTLCLDEKEYNKKKDAARMSEEANAQQDLWKSRTANLVQWLRSDYNLSYKKIADRLGITPQTLMSQVKSQDRQPNNNANALTEEEE